MTYSLQKDKGQKKPSDWTQQCLHLPESSVYSCGHFDESCEGTGVQPDLVVPICNLATWKAEAGRSQVRGHLGQHCETRSPN